MITDSPFPDAVSRVDTPDGPYRIVGYRVPAVGLLFDRIEALTQRDRKFAKVKELVDFWFSSPPIGEFERRYNRPFCSN